MKRATYVVSYLEALNGAIGVSRKPELGEQFDFRKDSLKDTLIYWNGELLTFGYEMVKSLDKDSQDQIEWDFAQLEGRVNILVFPYLKLKQNAIINLVLIEDVEKEV
jgi:hypothetical protein